ncbi:hypothetical protein KHS38_03380 [Mucilaginibacter sp. Bleaf8]|uniref:hypothetical protein n=1 Tax=Mucilaginibacter sp. Bleaf8 TaxID=2834430 RepID=UPI001BD016DC|nr:hypothetical protein [Mucilaginibacter sp. Bleaf8]MBS7563436.1 hypothetical protein [Mucilaginibacter sp. Bleaf8]
MQTPKKTANKNIASKNIAPKKTEQTDLKTKKSFDDDDDDDEYGAPLEDLDYSDIDRYNDEDDY